ncbi:MAG: restriction endonuclease subunit S [Ardenticatenales bacterium]|nr:restriction endonuclease subunit S [Ardenticatenales bacterium]
MGDLMSYRDAGIQPSPTAEVPLGYKRTEIGVIPQEWTLHQLGELVFRIGSGITPRGGSKVYVANGRPFVRSQNVGWGKLELDDLVFITDAVHETFRASEIEKGDVLLNITGASIGRSAVANERLHGGNVNQHVCEIRPHPELLDSRYLSSYLLSEVGQQQIDSFQAGGNRQGLNYGQIASFFVPLPPLPEQRAIAAALSDVDALIAALDDLIAKKRGIKQATMQQLLTGKTRLKGFSGPWEERRLGEIATITMGQSPSSAFYNLDGNGLPLIQGNADIEKRQSIERVWTMQANKRCAAGNILLTVRAPVGFVGIATSEVCLGRGVCGIQAHQNIDFLFHQLVLCEPQWKALEQGSTFTAANRNQVEQFNISIPMDGSEQRAIAEVLSDMDAELDALEARREKTRQLKQGMMQQLLTGKVRLVTPEETP